MDLSTMADKIRPILGTHWNDYTEDDLEVITTDLYDGLQAHLSQMPGNKGNLPGNPRYKICVLAIDELKPETGLLYVADPGNYPHLHRGTEFSIDESLSGDAIKAGHGILIQNVNGNRIVTPKLEQEVHFAEHPLADTQDAAAFPLINHEDGTIFGAVAIDGRKGDGAIKPEIMESLESAVRQGAGRMVQYVLANRDELTGLFNKRKLLKELKKAYHDVTKRKSSDFSLIWLDVDNFKEFNDRWGHLLADELLAFVGKYLRKSRRQYFQAKYGGEEFVIFIENGLDVAAQEAENIRRDLYQETAADGRFNGGITVSAGVANIGQVEAWLHYQREQRKVPNVHGKEEYVLMDIADHAELAAKGRDIYILREGKTYLLPREQMKDKVCVWSPKAKPIDGLLVQLQGGKGEEGRKKYEGKELDLATIVPGAVYTWFRL